MNNICEFEFSSYEKVEIVGFKGKIKKLFEITF